MIDDESLVKTRTNTCLSYASAIPSYSVVKIWFHGGGGGLTTTGKVLKHMSDFFSKMKWWILITTFYIHP